MRIPVDLKLAFSSDPYKTYEYWDIHKDRIRISTYQSIVFSCLVGCIIILFVDTRGWWFFVGSIFVLLNYHMNNTVFLLASRLNRENIANESERENRTEYLKRNLQTGYIEFRTSLLFFILPKVLFFATILAAAVFIAPQLL